jgi:uncharacterized protein
MFSVAAQEKLRFYVYALFDPRNEALPFYVGKGSGNRVFSHAAGEPAGNEVADVDQSAKLLKICEIRAAGLQVAHRIVRFDMTEDEADLVEASLIDLLNHVAPNALTNQISGQGVAEGLIDARDLAVALDAQPLVSDRPLLILRIERLWSQLLEVYGTSNDIPRKEIYEATCRSWKLNLARARQADCVLSVARGIVRAVFVPTSWFASTDPQYPGRQEFSADFSLPISSSCSSYVGKSVVQYFGRGVQTSVRYINLSTTQRIT